jgi:tRNA(Leu) C34 or U34 (ribose-2'-O)-methylase TrmL
MSNEEEDTCTLLTIYMHLCGPADFSLEDMHVSSSSYDMHVSSSSYDMHVIYTCIYADRQKGEESTCMSNEEEDTCTLLTICMHLCGPAERCAIFKMRGV